MQISNRWVAIILAFFVGGIGIHRFYTGQTLLGLMYLAMCWTPLPWLMSIVDIMTWLFITDERFDLKFN